MLDRISKKEDDVLSDFASIMMRFLSLEHSERINWKLKAKSLSGNCDWQILIENYVTAHNAALERKG